MKVRIAAFAALAALALAQATPVKADQRLTAGIATKNRPVISYAVVKYDRFSVGVGVVDNYGGTIDKLTGRHHNHIVNTNTGLTYHFAPTVSYYLAGNTNVFVAFPLHGASFRRGILGISFGV